MVDEAVYSYSDGCNRLTLKKRSDASVRTKHNQTEN